MNAFTANVIADLNARIDANDGVDFSHYDTNIRRIVVTRRNTGSLYTYVVQDNGNIIFLPYHA